MNRAEHLMTVGMEECGEVAQRISKAMRFGMEQVQQDADDQPQQNPERLTNRERIQREFYDLRAALRMVGIDPMEDTELSRRCEQEKAAKVERYLARSARCGTLQEGIGGQ